MACHSGGVTRAGLPAWRCTGAARRCRSAFRATSAEAQRSDDRCDRNRCAGVICGAFCCVKNRLGSSLGDGFVEASLGTFDPSERDSLDRSGAVFRRPRPARQKPLAACKSLANRRIARRLPHTPALVRRRAFRVHLAALPTILSLLPVFRGVSRTAIRFPADLEFSAGRVAREARAREARYGKNTQA